MLELIIPSFFRFQNWAVGYSTDTRAPDVNGTRPSGVTDGGRVGLFHQHVSGVKREQHIIYIPETESAVGQVVPAAVVLCFV